MGLAIPLPELSPKIFFGLQAGFKPIFFWKNIGLSPIGPSQSACLAPNDSPYFSNLGGVDDEVLAGDGLSTGGLVVDVVLMVVRVPVLRHPVHHLPASIDNETPSYPPSSGI